MRLGQRVGLVREKLGEVVRDHRRAGARGHHDVLGIAEDVQKVAGDLRGFVAVAAIEGGLAAAGLCFGKVDGVAEPFEHLGHGQADLGKDLIDDAGGKESDSAGWHWQSRLYRASGVELD